MDSTLTAVSQTLQQNDVLSPASSSGLCSKRKRTHEILLVGVVGVKQVDETPHEALLFGKVFWVRLVGRLVGLVLDQRGHQVQDGVHLQEADALD